MANFPATLSDLQSYISNLVNDPTNIRYTLSLINNQLDIAQDRWNLDVKICRTSQTLTVVAGQATYALNTLTGTFMKVLRVAHKGIGLTKRSKDTFDMFSAIDWTTTTGTPGSFLIDLTLNPPVLMLYPQPTSLDAGAFLLVEYLVRHTTMVNPTDLPFTANGVQNTLIAPYVFGLGLDVAASLLEPDPTPETVAKAKTFRAQANSVLSTVQEIYSDFDLDEPYRMQGGRTWVPTRTVSSPFTR